MGVSLTRSQGNYVTIAAAVLITILSLLFMHKLPRTRGRVFGRTGVPGFVLGFVFHASYFVACVAILTVLPNISPGLDKVMFSQEGVVLVGTILPLFESVRAVISEKTSDDTAWLQYWLAYGCFSYSTEFVDTIIETSKGDTGIWSFIAPLLRDHWYEMEFFFMVWLFFPFTDGATLCYDIFTRPILVPILGPIKAKCDGWIMATMMMFVNCGHFYMMWWCFLMLPTSKQRFVTIAAGTVYPLMASLMAVATPDDTDDVVWLTYWVCYSTLFICMDYIENFIGSIPGFYCICLCCTVYLMLPLFRGAEQVFRNIIVPLAGQKQALLESDARKLRKEIEKSLSKGNLPDAYGAIAKIFAEAKDAASGTAVPKKIDAPPADPAKPAAAPVAPAASSGSWFGSKKTN